MASPPTPPIDLEALFEAHRTGLAGAVRGILGPRADVEEVLQDAFLAAWCAERAGTRAASPVGWIFVLTMNQARTVRRKVRRRRVSLELDEVDEVSLTSKRARPEAVVAAREEQGAAQAAIHALPERQKEVFLLRVSGGLAFQEVATALDIPVGTAKTRMRLALAELRQSLQAFAPLGSPDRVSHAQGGQP
ncbi:ECF RNA polymerase sigma-E factor [Planctomycetes bacterium Poly30]|uniref:ECF RNA polymerase sigma-E factor n=1 Tax=Saltatorellus ferox TaxID=2528018 RepID=A0A518ELZ2_9BACT|nr:ECF RNA polymerase sigma-E factor [Planctomycetes bacterium Poly30]